MVKEKPVYTKPRLEDFVFDTDAIDNTLGMIIPIPETGIMKALISKGQYALEQSDNSFSTFSFKGWKVSRFALGKT